MSKIKVFLLLVFFAICAYWTSIKYGFSQDDWFHLTISQANNLGQFIDFFNPYKVNWIFFRPLSTQLPYWLASTLFPLSIAPHFMHMLMILIHVVNSYLVYIIAKKYLKPNFALLLGVFYVVSSVHFLSLFYIGAIQQLISTFFSLLAIKVYLEGHRPPQFTLALLTLCALLSKELSVRLPMILFVLGMIRSRRVMSSLKSIAGPLIVTLLYFLLRYFAGAAQAAEYVLNFSPTTTLATIMWYGLFLLGLPEELLHYGLSGGAINIAGFIHDHGFSAMMIILTGITLFTLLLRKFIITFKSTNIWQPLIFLALGCLTLLPIIFLPTHRYPHYLDLSILFVGIYLFLDITKITKMGLGIFLFVVAGSLVSINLETSTHWTTKRAVLSDSKMQEMIDSRSCDNSNSITFTGSHLDMLELSYAFSLANGPRIICQNPILQVYYKELP
jgi:hypothetical protein